MHLTAWVTLVALSIYVWTGMNAAAARVKHGVLAPRMDGPEEFTRRLRVQLNTLEQLPLFLAPLWMCAWFLGDAWAAGAGVLWCVGRVVYALTYYKDPTKRTFGFVTSLAASLLLMGGTVLGLLLN